MVFALKLCRHYLYGVHVDVFTHHKSLQHVFTLTELNPRQRRWLELLKNYDMNCHYHQRNAYIVDDALSSRRMGSTTDIEDEKKELAKDIHRLARLGVRLVNSTSGDVSVHPSSEPSLVVEVKKGQHLHPVLVELKD